MAAAAREIQIGDVYFLRCKNCNPPKDKHFVVVNVDPLKMFIISSEPNEFQQRHADIMAALAPMWVSEHPFMHHDSYIGCHHLSHEYQLDDLKRLLVLHPQIYLGSLSENARDAIRRALKGNEHVPRKWLNLLQPNWAFDSP